jgi:hypothetical protein
MVLYSALIFRITVVHVEGVLVGITIGEVNHIARGECNEIFFVVRVKGEKVRERKRGGGSLNGGGEHSPSEGGCAGGPGQVLEDVFLALHVDPLSFSLRSRLRCSSAALVVIRALPGR